MPLIGDGISAMSLSEKKSNDSYQSNRTLSPLLTKSRTAFSSDTVNTSNLNSNNLGSNSGTAFKIVSKVNFGSESFILILIHLCFNFYNMK